MSGKLRSLVVSLTPRHPSSSKTNSRSLNVLPDHPPELQILEPALPGVRLLQAERIVDLDANCTRSRSRCSWSRTPCLRGSIVDPAAVGRAEVAVAELRVL